MTIRKTIALTIGKLGKVMSLLFNTLFRFVMSFFPRSRRLLISWLQSQSAAILETKNIKSTTDSTLSPSICHEVMGWDDMIFWILSFKPVFSFSSFSLIRSYFSSSLVSTIRVELSAYLRLLIFLLASWVQLVLHPALHFTWCNLHIS